MDTVSSSRRFKEDIQDMADASSGLMRLRPVTFRYQKPFADGSKPIQYGLIAEEVAEVYPDLVAHSADRQIETVNYQVLDSMLLNEVQISPSVKGQYRLQFLVAIQTDLGPPSSILANTTVEIRRIVRRCPDLSPMHPPVNPMA